MANIYFNPVSDINSNNQFGNTSRVLLANMEIANTADPEYLTLFSLKRYIANGEGVFPTSRLSIQVLISEDANPSNTTLIPFEGAGEMFGLVELMPPGWSLEASNTFVVMYDLENLERPFQLSVSNNTSEERSNQPTYTYSKDFDTEQYYWWYINWINGIWSSQITHNWETRKWELSFDEEIDNVPTHTVIDTSEELYTEEDLVNGSVILPLKQPWEVTWDNNTIVEIPQNVKNVTENRDFLPYAFGNETGLERFTRLKNLGY